MSLTIFNPFKDALKNVSGIEKVGGLSGNWKYKGFCWTCSKDKPKVGGSVKGHHDGKAGFSAGAPTRFTCIDCLEIRAAKKALKQS